MREEAESVPGSGVGLVWTSSSGIRRRDWIRIEAPVASEIDTAAGQGILGARTIDRRPIDPGR